MHRVCTLCRLLAEMVSASATAISLHIIYWHLDTLCDSDEISSSMSVKHVGLLLFGTFLTITLTVQSLPTVQREKQSHVTKEKGKGEITATSILFTLFL